MKYMGSKARHASEILPIILAARTGEGQAFVEPFVGGCNVMDRVTGLRVGGDLHPELVALWRAVSSGWMPPHVVTEEEYGGIKRNPKDYPACLVGYVGFALSYGGKWMGGWCRSRTTERDYVAESLRNAQRQFPKLRGVEFHCAPYDALPIPPNSLIYCDPPYRGTTGYKGGFDHDAFYTWCRAMAAAGHTIFVSEYSMPDDFECVWEKAVASSLVGKQGVGKKAETERLYTLSA